MGSYHSLIIILTIIWIIIIYYYHIRYLFIVSSHYRLLIFKAVWVLACSVQGDMSADCNSRHGHFFSFFGAQKRKG